MTWKRKNKDSPIRKAKMMHLYGVEKLPAKKKKRIKFMSDKRKDIVGPAIRQASHAAMMRDYDEQLGYTPCQYHKFLFFCNVPADQSDHIEKRGSHPELSVMADPANLLPACAKCNLVMRSHDIESERRPHADGGWYQAMMLKGKPGRSGKKVVRLLDALGKIAWDWKPTASTEWFQPKHLLMNQE